jgi:hypothetical protein
LATEEQFDATFEQFKAAIGGTNADYHRILQQSYQLLPSVPDDVWEATKALVQEAFDRFAATVHPSILGQIEYSTFDIALETLTVTALNTETYETSIAPVRSDGSFVFPNIGDGEYQLTVSGGAVITSPRFTVTVAEGEPAQANVPIMWGGASTGIVRSESEQPLADARVSLQAPDLELYYSVLTQEDGAFEIRDIYPGTYIVTISLAPYVEHTSTITIDPGQAIDGVVDLVRGATLTGSVTDEDTGAPVSEAQVWASNTESGALLLATADAEGNYELPGMPIGFWEVSVSHPDYVDSQPQPLNVAGSVTITQNLQIARGGSISDGDDCDRVCRLDGPATDDRRRLDHFGRYAGRSGRWSGSARGGPVQLR